MTKSSIEVTMDWVRTIKANRNQGKITLTEYKDGKPLKPRVL